MHMEMAAALIGILAGATGYCIGAFWMQPILKYRELRLKVYGDFVFYAQVVSADGLNERLKALYVERVMANRRTSADLAACLTQLPRWYVWWLLINGQTPMRAASHLIGYSNSIDHETAHKIAEKIKRDLGFKEVSE